jgi:hypothetical protein
MWHVWRTAESGFWWGNLKEREHLGDTGIEGRMLLQGIFNK